MTGSPGTKAYNDGYYLKTNVKSKAWNQIRDEKDSKTYQL